MHQIQSVFVSHGLSHMFETLKWFCWLTRDCREVHRPQRTTSCFECIVKMPKAHICTLTFFSGCQHPVGLSRGKAKVCYYSGWYYCQSCHQDNSFLIPARLLHNWDTSKHKVRKLPRWWNHNLNVSVLKLMTVL